MNGYGSTNLQHIYSLEDTSIIEAPFGLESKATNIYGYYRMYIIDFFDIIDNIRHFHYGGLFGFESKRTKPVKLGHWAISNNNLGCELGWGHSP